MNLAPILIWSVALLSVLCMLVRPFGLREFYWPCTGAVLLLVLGLLPAKEVLHAIVQGWDIYLFLAGMMILAELAKEEGVFDWAAGYAASKAQGSKLKLLMLIYLVGVIVTVFCSNDATAVILTPAVLAVTRKAQVPAKPYLLACALVANAASFVLPISNPANLVFYGSNMPPLLSWLKIFLFPSIASIGLTLVFLLFFYRKSLEGAFKRANEFEPLTKTGRITLLGLMFAAICILCASKYGFALGPVTCVVALTIMLLTSVQDKGILKRVPTKPSWSILPLVAGLFVLVAGLNRAGALSSAASLIVSCTRNGDHVGRFLAGFGVALATNVANNLPVGLFTASATHSTRPSDSIMHSILIGVDLGPNLSISGSLATILWAVALRREGITISGVEFFKAGLVAMPLTLAGSLLLVDLW